MSLDTSDLLSCTYGGAAIRLTDYSLKQEAVVKSGVGRVGTKVTIDLEGTIEGAGTSGYAAKVAAVQAAFAKSKQELVVAGPGGRVELRLPPSLCVDDGPHVAFEIATGDTAQRTIRATIVGERVPAQGESGHPPTEEGEPEGPPPVLDSHKTKVATRPDGLTTITRSGELNGIESERAFLGGILAEARRLYPWPQWSVSHDYETSADADKLKTSYSVVATRMLSPLPGGAESLAVEGDASIRIDRDEQMRLTYTHEFDLLVQGDPYALAGALREGVTAYHGGIPILKESVQVSTLREARLRATYAILLGGGGSSLLNWQQTIRHQFGADIYDVKQYVGAAPLLLLRADRFETITQTGSAVGAGAYIAPPQPLEGTYHIDEPEVSLEEINGVERRTSWSFRLAVADSSGRAGPIRLDLRSLGRPGLPLYLPEVL